jgi:hypothetical protein
VVTKKLKTKNQKLKTASRKRCAGGLFEYPFYKEMDGEKWQ